MNQVIRRISGKYKHLYFFFSLIKILRSSQNSQTRVFPETRLGGCEEKKQGSHPKNVPKIGCNKEDELMSKEEKIRFSLQLHTGAIHGICINPVLNGMTKPNGGFWTSTLLPGGSYASDWVRYLVDDSKRWNVPKSAFFKDASKVLLLKINPNAKVLHIDGIQDFERIIFNCYSGEVLDRIRNIPTHLLSSTYIDWEKMSREYDGVHLTAKGVAETQELDRFAGWSCESTCWFKHVFVAVIPYTKPIVRASEKNIPLF